MSILLGIQSEVNMRTYYESQAKTTYLLGDVRQGPIAPTKKRPKSARAPSHPTKKRPIPRAGPTESRGPMLGCPVSIGGFSGKGQGAAGAKNGPLCNQ